MLDVDESLIIDEHNSINEIRPMYFKIVTDCTQLVCATDYCNKIVADTKIVALLFHNEVSLLR